MHQFISCVPIDVLTQIIVSTAKANIYSENFSFPVRSIINDLGNEVMAAYHTRLKTNEDNSYMEHYLESLSRYYDWYCSPQGGRSTHREAIHSVTEDISLNQQFVKWPKSIRTAIGTEMFQIMFREILIDRDMEGKVVSEGKVLDNEGNLLTPIYPTNRCPAFFKVFRKSKDNKDVEELKPHPSLTAVYDANSLVDLEFPSADVPMVAPPLPWISPSTGAYLIQESKLVKVPEYAAEANDAMLASITPESLYPVLDSINQLSSVPWIVNKPILELACKLFLEKTDEGLLN